MWIPGLASIPTLVSRGAAASKEVKQAVGVLAGALAWTQSWAWPTGCVACREWGLEAPWRTGTSPSMCADLLGSCMWCGWDPQGQVGPRPLPLPGLCRSLMGTRGFLEVGPGGRGQELPDTSPQVPSIRVGWRWGDFREPGSNP